MLKSAGILLGFCLISAQTVKAQDSLNRVSFKLGAEFWGSFVSHPYNPRSNRPAYLDQNSFNSRDTLKDSPVKHGAYYAAIKTTTSFLSIVTLNVNLYGEHRGLSYGIYNRENTVLYPYFNIQIKDSIRLVKRQFLVTGKAGDFFDKRMDEGLFIYNVDAQGGEVNLVSGRWKGSVAWYGDFYRSIGLNIDDVFGASVNRSFGKGHDYIAGFAAYAFPPPGAKAFNHLYYSVYLGRRYANASLYLQAGLQSARNRGNYYSRGLAQQGAIVAGGNFNRAKKKWALTITGEGRYYGSSINISHSDNRVRYRNPDGNLYANTVGEYLYPLRKYDNLFSQWAALTEYAVCNVLGASVNGLINYKVSKKTIAAFDLRSKLYLCKGKQGL